MSAWYALVPHDSVLCYRNKANVLLGVFEGNTICTLHHNHLCYK